jgi:hypothetical protein
MNQVDELKQAKKTPSGSAQHTDPSDRYSWIIRHGNHAAQTLQRMNPKSTPTTS